MIRDRKALRAHTFTLAAVHTLGRPSAQRRRLAVVRNRFLHLPVSKLLIHGRKDFRDGDLLWAALRAVMAGRTGDGG